MGYTNRYTWFIGNCNEKDWIKGLKVSKKTGNVIFRGLKNDEILIAIFKIAHAGLKKWAT